MTEFISKVILGTIVVMLTVVSAKFVVENLPVIVVLMCAVPMVTLLYLTATGEN